MITVTLKTTVSCRLKIITAYGGRSPEEADTKTTITTAIIISLLMIVAIRGPALDCLRVEQIKLIVRLIIVTLYSKEQETKKDLAICFQHPPMKK